MDTTSFLQASEPRPYEMTIQMSVLDSLGISLYSNVAAVLSELVANAWDADANLVQVNWDQNTVSITDDGTGMSRDDLIDRFLTVGYSKRKTEGNESKKYQRKFMGRKGIGKLSVFSVANKVEIHTRKNGEASALCIELEKLREAIERDETYTPQTIEVAQELDGDGTYLRLSALNSRRISVSANALRKRLARRFDVLYLGEISNKFNNLRADDSDEAQKLIADLCSRQDDSSSVHQLESLFIVTINGKQVNYSDRIDFKSVEYLWEFDRQSIPEDALPNIKERFIIPGILSQSDEWNVTGWFGTASKPKQLDTDSEAGNLKGLIVLAHGRPIQEDILGSLQFNRLFGNYLTGQVRADFLDDDEDDIATSDRQRLMEDDPRVKALTGFLRDAILAASDTWATLRPQNKATEALETRPAVEAWYAGLKPYQQEPAKKLIGAIETLQIPEKKSELTSEDFRTQLYKSSIVAFERLAIRENSKLLEKFSNLQFADVMALLSNISTYENAMYGDLIKARLEVVESFQNDVDGNSLEKVLQHDIHKNMWLLDPAWGPATTNVKIEERLQKMADDEGSKRGVSSNSNARMDLRYCNLQGRHIIVELKRPGVRPQLDALYEQGVKYVTGLDEVLAELNRSNEFYEVVYILGKEPAVPNLPPRRNKEEFINKRLAEVPARILYYNQLIASAKEQYQDYISAHSDTDRLSELLTQLENGE